MTLSTLYDDARAVLNHAESLGFSQFALLGTRVGALVAAATVASLPLRFPSRSGNHLRILSASWRRLRGLTV